ncbi:HNH endonuclease [Serratia ureilytica]|uniref:HNH endonuclease n=1 Tax=Serratia ureilytica TaxID=300181 RepID=UPI0018E8D70B|nr:HNH endonuclease [Serratia ureilytica]MBJ2111329.1 HNH endonuclease [Serratia ureilytica]
MDNEQQFFWVNHKKTEKVEISEGFIWAPKTKVNGHKNQTYLNLTEVRPGDLIFSYANLKLGAVGKALSSAYDFEKPDEFRDSDGVWLRDGWRIDVQFERLQAPIRPKQFIAQIQPLLPKKYSPLQKDGNGNESCYLAKLDNELGELLLELCDRKDLVSIDDFTEFEEIEKDILEILSAKELPEIMKEALVKARIGQGFFRQEVLKLYPACPVTGVTMPQLLIASHIKPWRECNNKERLDPNNGIMLAPHVDALFDKGYISFTNDGVLIVKADREVVNAMSILGLTDVDKVTVSESSHDYLDWHRAHYKF